MNKSVVVMGVEQVENIGDGYLHKVTNKMLSPTSLTPLEIITNPIWSCHQQIIQYQAVLFYQRLVVQLLSCLRAVKLLVILSSLKLFKNRKFRFRIKLFLNDGSRMPSDAGMLMLNRREALTIFNREEHATWWWLSELENGFES